MTGIVKFTGLRGMVARKMAASVEETAQLSFFTDCDASALVEARQAWKSAGKKIGYEDLIIAALPALAAAFPLFNATEQEDGVHLSDAVHVGCAISVGDALMVPVVRDCQNKPVEEIADDRRDLIDRAMSKKLKVADMSGGTITISNLGLTRVDHFSPILNRPQTAIIGLGRIRDAAVVDPDSGEIKAGKVMGLSLTVDHRLIDGQPAGEFLSALAEAIENKLSYPAS